MAEESKIIEPLLAEHGLSLFIKIFKGNQQHSILMDAGWSEIGVIHNLKILGVDLSDIEAIVLSHGHMDHFGGLKKILALLSQKISLIFHPDVLLDSRFLQLPNGERVNFPALDESFLKKTGASLIKTSSPYILASDLVATTGEIERVTDFERGLPGAYFERDGKIEPDYLLDDHGLVINLKDKGLVVISGCAHSGIINTVYHAQKIIGTDQVYAIMGGFHLGGSHFEPAVGITIKLLKEIDPEVIVPMHCTGFKATTRIAQEMPDRFILSSVGTKILL
jgi:7,8-dihydropterin-6-yl-methyl-4-(beta-D-ribofuranosyl)aminobenzene 5'-phosphate synthase